MCFIDKKRFLQQMLSYRLSTDNTFYLELKPVPHFSNPPTNLLQKKNKIKFINYHSLRI